MGYEVDFFSHVVTLLIILVGLLLILTILILGGLQLMAMGIIGEYLGRLFMESKRRPLFLLDEYQPPQNAAPNTEARVLVAKA